MVTEPKATRFFLTKNQSVDLMLNGLNSDSSKPYCDIPKSTSIGNLLQAMANKYLPKGKELKVKESDRLELIRLNLVNCGCECEVINDDLIIRPSENYFPINNKIRTDFDHRIAMSFAVMGSRINNLVIFLV